MIILRQLPPSLEQTGSVSIAALKDRHVGETAYLVGKGASLHQLTARDIGPGFVLCLSESILHVESFNLSNPLYVMQKDGCVTGSETIPRPCETCAPLGWRRFPVVDPSSAVTTIFEQHLSSWCLHGRANRYVYNGMEDCGSPDPHTMSVLEAIPLAKLMGARAIVMLCFDSLVTGSLAYAYPTGDAEATQIAETHLMNVRPVVLAALQAFGPHSFYCPTATPQDVA